MAAGPAIGALQHLDLTVPSDNGPGELLVAYKAGVPEMDKAGVLRQAGVQAMGRGRSGVARVKAANQRDAMVRLRKDTRVKYVEPNYQRKATGMPTADPLQSQQWFLDSIGTQQAWGHFVPTNATPVTVAVLDTGVAAGHPDLAGRVLPGYNFASSSALFPDPADTTDWVGHGTHVSGIIAALAGNGQGGAGVAGPANVKILPVKVLGDDGGGYVSDIADGIYWATDHGARVINMSLGGPGRSQTEQDAIEYAVNHGVLVVVAAGNESTQAQLSDPANQAGVITVSATDSQGQLAWFSNYGAAVDVAAPGVNILSTVPSFIDPSGYAKWSGTSMATPVVSATAALIAAGNPTYSRGDIEAHLLSTLKSSSFWDPQFGYGQIDTGRVVDTSADHAPYAIRIKGLWRGQQVFGPVQVAVERNSDTVSRVDVRTGSGRQVATWDLSGKPDLSWWMLNPAMLDPNDDQGQSTVVFAAYNAAGRPITQQTLSVDNRATVSSGIRVQLLAANGQALKGTVDAYLVDENGATYSGSANVDTSGWANLTAPTVWDGRSYTLVAHSEVPGANGKDQAIWVQDNVAAPATLTLEAASLRPMDVTVKDLNADKVSTAQAGAELWGSPVVARGDHKVPVIDGAPYVMGFSGADGKSRIWLSDGLYNLAAFSDNAAAGQNFYLLRRNMAVSSTVKPLTLDETGSITATYMPTAPGTRWAFMQISDDTGLAPLLDATRPMRVPPDTEAGMLWVAALNQSHDHLYNYIFFPTDTMRLGDNHQLTEGWITENSVFLSPVKRGDYLYGVTDFATPYGWTLGYAAALPAGGSGGSIFLGDPASVAMLKASTVPSNGPKPARRVQAFRVEGNSVRALETASADPSLRPTVTVTRGTETVATIKDPNLVYGAWRIPTDAAGGDYSWNVTLDAGPLGPPSTQGVVTISEPFNLPGTLAGNQIQLNILGRDHNPIPADQVDKVYVSLFAKTDSGWSWVGTRSPDAMSKAVFSNVNPDGQYLAEAWSGTYDQDHNWLDGWITWETALPGQETTLDAGATVATTWSATLDGNPLPGLWALEVSEDGLPLDTFVFRSQGSIPIHLPAQKSVRSQLLSDQPALFIDDGPAETTADGLVVTKALSTTDGSLQPLTIASAKINPDGHSAAVGLYLAGSDMLKYAGSAVFGSDQVDETHPLSILVPANNQFSFYADVYQDLNEQGWVYTFYGGKGLPATHHLGDSLTLYTEWTNKQTTAQDGAAAGLNVLYDAEGHLIISMEGSQNGFGVASRPVHKAGLVPSRKADKGQIGLALGKALADRNQEAYRAAAAQMQGARSEETSAMPSVKLTDASGRTLAQASGYGLNEHTAGYGYWTLPITNVPALGLPGGDYTLTSEVQTATGTFTTDPQQASQAGVWIKPGKWSPTLGNLTIGYQFPDANPQAVTVAVYNAAGQLVAKPGDMTPDTNPGTLTWNGKSTANAALPKGIYRVLALPQTTTPPTQIAAAVNYLSADYVDINAVTLTAPKPNKLPAAIGAGGLTVTGTAPAGTHLVVQRKLGAGTPETVDLGQEAQVSATGTFRFDVSFPQDGSYSLLILAEDSYGNRSPVATAGPVSVDTARPTLNVTTPLIQEATHMALTKDATVTVTGTTEAGATVVGVARGRDAKGQNFEKTANVKAGTNGAFSLSLQVGEGVTNVVLNAADAVGNRADTVSFGVMVDKKAPVVKTQVRWYGQWVAPGSSNAYSVGNTTTAPVDIYFTADEMLQGDLPTVTYGTAKTPLPVSLEYGMAHVQLKGLTANTTVTAVAKDLAGNTTTVSLTIKVDAQAPVITITKPSTATTVLYVTTAAKDTALGIEGTSTEPLAFLGVEWSGPGDPDRIATRVTYQDTKQTKFRMIMQAPEEGTYTVRLVGYDAAGNKSKDSTLQKTSMDSRTIVVDGTAPQKPDVDPLPASTTSTSLMVWTSASDALSGVAKVEYFVTDGTRAVLQGGKPSLLATVDSATGKYKGSVSLKANVVNEITVRVTDKAGNVAEAGPFRVAQGSAAAASLSLRAVSLKPGMVDVTGTTNKPLLVDGNRFGPETAVVEFVDRLGKVVATQEAAIDEAGRFTFHMEQLPAGYFRVRVTVKVSGFLSPQGAPGEKRFENAARVTVR